ncbi:hypothetical protein EHZ19_06700 [Paraburkholderia bannensis]|nr:hypothetical protein [Paraburkholderia bannensis]RQM49325.1 hypothetical protein EHZ19_06700 [Paraburkholderia bannensis]
MNSSKEIVAALFEAKKVEDLERLGSQADLCTALNEVYHPFELSADTYEKLFSAVEAVRSSLRNLNSYPFVSRQAAVVYNLTELEGAKRNERLGVTDAMYDDKALARRWYKSIAQLVHSDKVGGDSGPMQSLKKLYEKITHEPAPEE